MTSPSSQPEYRKDPLSNTWVIVADERNGRPEEFKEIATFRAPQPCPFCLGNERETPGEVLQFPPRDKVSPEHPWQVRVVPNKFPAVLRNPPHVKLAAETGSAAASSLYQSRPAHGGHEVIIESALHVVSLTEFSDDVLDFTFQAYRERILAYAAEKPWQYVQVFKNVGAAAGSSIEHAHSQVVALPTVPAHIADELTHAEYYFQSHQRHIFRDLCQQELALGKRVVMEDEHFIAICPFASRFPFETWILPREVQSHFEQLSVDRVRACGRFVRKMISLLEATLPKPAYNYVLHTAPLTGPHESYCWHIELIPRLTKLAGFEWGTGYFINPLSPESAAARLRGVANKP